MADPTPIPDAIKQVASEPAQATADGVSVRNHSPSELIEADRYVKSTEAQASNSLGITIRRFRSGRPGGS